MLNTFTCNPCRALTKAADEGLLTSGFFWIPSLGGPSSMAAQKAVRTLAIHMHACFVSVSSRRPACGCLWGFACCSSLSLVMNKQQRAPC